MTDFFVSTTSFKKNRVSEILRQAKQLNIDGIELGSGVIFDTAIPETLYHHRNDFRFAIHNYFPPPRIPFLLNLASGIETSRKRSVSFCKDALALSADIGAFCYSVHCGFAFDGDGSELGSVRQTELPRIALDHAMENFIKSLNELIPVADRLKVPFAIENNAVAEFALIHGKNQTAIGADAKSIAEIFQNVVDGPLYLMLDLGHAKVNQSSLGKPVKELLIQFGDRTIGMHISDNDGKRDLHQPISEESDLLPFLQENKCSYLVIETHRLYEAKIKEQLTLLENINTIR